VLGRRWTFVSAFNLDIGNEIMGKIVESCYLI